jgi:hypothetical protein
MEEFKEIVSDVIGESVVDDSKIQEMYDRLHTLFFNSTQSLNNKENIILYKKLKNIENILNKNTVKTKTKKTDSVFASKSAEKYATENNIDIKNITGTGKDGKIKKGDLIDKKPQKEKPQKEKPQKEKPQKEKCKGYTAKGDLCRRNALESGYCKHHTLEHEQEEKQKEKKKVMEKILDDNENVHVSFINTQGSEINPDMSNITGVSISESLRREFMDDCSAIDSVIDDSNISNFLNYSPN